MQDVTGGPESTPTAGHSLREAAGLLGVSVTTLRRRIVAGRVHAARVARPGGSAWRVYLDGRPPPPPPVEAETLASSTRATVAPIVAPLVAELAASRQAVERQAGRVAELEREFGRLSAQFQAAVADAVAARTRATALTAELERGHADRRTGPAEAPPAPMLVVTMSPGLQQGLRRAALALVITVVAAALALLLFVLPPLETFM